MDCIGDNYRTMVPLILLLVAMATGVTSLDLTTVTCPESCTCTVSGEDENALDVDCSYQDLTSIPDMSSLKGSAVHRIHLDLNLISDIHSEAFEGLDVKGINLNFNPIANVSENAFSGIEDTLNFLMMRQTNLNTMPSKFLDGLTELQVLDMSDTKSDLFKSITSVHFPPLPKLADFSMNRCGINEISTDAFGEMEAKSVTIISLQGNKLTCVPEALKIMKTLRKIDLSMNRISQINASDFEGLKVESLNLDSNIGLELNANSFQSLSSSLSSLSMAWCDMSLVPGESLKHLSALKTLKLAGNTITQLDENDLDGLNIETLDLSNNLGLIINENGFRGVEKSLKVLTLSKISMTEIPAALTDITALETLVLSRNKLTTIGDMSSITATNIDLSSNLVMEISGPFNEGPLSLSLTNNKIESIDFIDGRCQFKAIDLQRNQKVNCTCPLLSLALTEGVVVNGECAMPDELQGEKIQSEKGANYSRAICDFKSQEACVWSSGAVTFDLATCCIAMMMLHAFYLIGDH